MRVAPLLVALLSVVARAPATPQAGTGAASAGSPSPAVAATRADWPSYNGSLEGVRYSELAQITPANAARLERACTFDTGEQMSMQSGPVVVGGVL